MKKTFSQRIDLLVKVVIEVLSPSFEESTAAATEMLYWNPGIKSGIVKEVPEVLLKPSPIA